jgi:glycerophosphoryl diester phosphodiesterase
MKKVLINYVVLISALALAAGCISTTGSFKPELHHSPLIIAHRAGGGQWPQNSRTAVMSSIARAGAKNPAQRYHGIEIDIVLTKDGHPVLSHDPWVHTTLCQTVSGEPIGDRILIRDLTLAELQSQFICGGIADKDFSQVVPKGEKIMTLDEVLDALESAPEMVLYLDVKVDSDITASAEAYARAISKRLEAARLPNRLYIEKPSAESLSAYRSAIRAKFVAVLSYPPFSAKENSVLTAIIARWFTKLRLRSPLDKAQEAKAGAVAGPKQVITWTAARQARDNGVAVVLFAPNTRKDLYKFCTWPVDMLITDYPELGHCP